MLRLVCILFLFLIPMKSMALLNVGGYVPFGLTTQKKEDGGKNTFSFKPLIGFNTVMPIPNMSHVFLPEFGFVPQGKEADEYSKSTLYFLMDLGYMITDRFLLRYGIGTFMTKVSGDGAAIQLPNGDGTATFYRPNKGETSWNTTLNLGVEYAIDANNAARFETYMFSWLSSARQLSYSLTYVYYL